MDVKLKRAEKEKGLLFKRTLYTVNLQVKFNPDELKIIKDANLQDTVLCEYDIWCINKWLPHVLLPKNIGDTTREFETRGEANKWEDRLREEILPRLKSLLQRSERRSGSEEFTL